MKFVPSQHPAAAAACCFRVVSDLHREIRLVEAELLLVRLRLAQCRARACDATVPSGLRMPPVCVNYPEKNYRWEYDSRLPLLHPNGLRDGEGCNCIELELFGADEAAVVNSFDPETVINSENNVLKDDGESILKAHDPRNTTSLLSLANTNGQDQSLDECL